MGSEEWEAYVKTRVKSYEYEVSFKERNLAARCGDSKVGKDGIKK